MAQSALATAVLTVDEYLATGYHPDVEFIDGQLKEKPVVAPIHGRVQVLLASWFHNHEEEWQVQTVVEVRTWVTKTRVRLPDVIVLAAGPLPRRALAEPPLLAIEVLSETDTFADLRDRARDLAGMGVRQVWLLDPQERTMSRWEDDLWRPVHDPEVRIPGSPVYLDLAWVWKRLGPQE